MGPRELQNKIHSTFLTSGSIWSGFRSEIVALYGVASNYDDFDNHLLREFNKKVRDLALDTGMYFIPYDGGLRFIGSSISPMDGFFFILNSSGTDKLIRPTGDNTTENIIAPDLTFYNVEP